MMKNSSEASANQKKLKNRKVITKRASYASITRRYLELRRLREQVSKIEALRSAGHA